MVEDDEDFDDYIWLENIGKGCGANVVCKVKHLTKNKTYALKKILIDIHDKEQTKKNSNEINIFKSVKHPYIIEYFDSFIKNPYLCIIMELAGGGDLQHVVKHYSKQQKEIPENQIWKWFLQLCQAIKHIHLKKILHRDIKTQNVFLDSNGTVRFFKFLLPFVLLNFFYVKR
jgi:NIMA (never in mitosis gene a)-related kinase